MPEHKVFTSKTAKDVKDAKAKLAHGVTHVRTMQEQVRNMFQFCCILGFGFSTYKIVEGTNHSSIAELIDLLVSAVLAMTVKRGGMVTSNATKLFVGSLSILHFLLFLVCVPASYSGYAFSDEIVALLNARDSYIRPLVDNNNLCLDFGKQLPLSTLLYFMIYISDRYMENTYRKTLDSYNAMVLLSERVLNSTASADAAALGEYTTDNNSKSQKKQN